METSSFPGVASTAGVSQLLERAEAGLAAMQEAQRAYDDAMWDIEDPAFAKLRHVHIHLSVTVGKIAKLVEPADHTDHRGEPVDVGDLRESLASAVADLLMHSAQIANLVDGDLGEFLRNRYRQNASRFAPDSDFAAL